MAAPRKISEQMHDFCALAMRLAQHHRADAALVLIEEPVDWRALRTELGATPLVVAAASAELLEDLPEDEIAGIQLSSREAPVFEQLTQALLEAVSKQKLTPNATVVALYSGFEDGIIDSLSVIRLDEHLGQLTVRDLRQIETRIPFETLKLVVDLAVDIGREGREGKPVGTMFVIGDHRKTLKYCRPMGFDPVRGYKPAERSLFDAKVREGVKEIAQMDGAFIVSDSGVVMASAQHVSAPPAVDISISKGLGARHWAAAEITRATAAVAVAVSSSSGAVRVFQGGKVILRIEPFRRAMKWKDFESGEA